jgi:DNA-binding transcriptional MerR regulator
MLSNMPSNSGHSALQIGEVAKLTALSVDAIRFYERSSLLPEVPRTPGRFRLFTHADIARLSFIRKMQSLGFSLREVRQILDLRESRLDACKEVSEVVKTKLAEVRSKIRELQKLEGELVGGLRKCNAERKHRSKNRSCPVLESVEAKEHSC